MKRNKKLIVAVLAFIAFYAALGFFVAPAIIQPRLVDGLSEATHRTVQLGKLRINPFTFSLTLKDFRLMDRDSTLLVSFRELYARYRVTSIFSHVWALAEFRLDTPFVAVRVMDDGKLSVSDLFANSSADTSTAAEGPPRPIEIGDLYITGGSILYHDQSGGRALTKVIDSLDLSLKDFTTAPAQAGMYEFEAITRQDERFHWRGNIEFGPLHSAGLIELAGVRASTLTDFMGDSLRFAAGSGTFSASGDYVFESPVKGTSFVLRHGRVDVTDLVLTSPLDTLPPVSIPSLHVGGITLEYPQNSVTVDTISGQGASFRAAYLADGSLTLGRIFMGGTNPADTAKSRFELLIKNLSTRDYSFLFTDRSRDPAASVALTGVNLEMGNFRYGSAGSATLSGSAVLNGRGSLELQGTFTMEPMRADLDLAIAGSPLAAFQPWAERYTLAQILAGTFGLRGKFSYAGKGKSSDMRFRGNVFSDGGQIRDPVLEEDLLRWGRLEFRSVDYRTTPASIQIAEIAATRPYARVIIGADRTLNIQHLAVVDTTAPPTQVKDTVSQSLTTIGKVTLTDGSMNFADQSLSPNFDIGIQQLKGEITGLSSKELARADVDLAGRVDNYAPVSIKGQINPLSGVAYTDIAMKFDGIELTSFTPYFSKFAGYKIQRGKLSLDLRYKLNNRHLDAENKIVLNQLTLGEKVESPDATSLPVKLAVALLKDSKGVIDLDIPISGSLDDPEFSVFPIIIKALMNLLWKIVTAPFALIGALFGGGGEDLQYVQFSPGVDSLTSDQQPKLESLVKGLTERPGLELEVKGASSPAEDRKALAEAAVISKVRPGTTAPLTERDGERILAVYRSTFKDDPGKLIPEGERSGESRDSLMVVLAHQRLVDSVKISDNDLRSLAQRRAAAVMAFVCQRGGIEPARVFLLEVDTGASPEEGRIRTTMNLTAR